MTDNHGGQCGSGLGVTQPEDEFAVYLCHVATLLGEPGGNPFAQGGDNRHVDGDDERIGAADDNPQVDEHAHPDEEIGNE